MVYLHHIETVVPSSSYSQSLACELMKTWVPGGKAPRYIEGIYKNSGIDKRHSVVDNFEGINGAGFFKTNGAGVFVEPTTKERNDIFALKSRTMVVQAADQALQACPDIDAADITHVITVSCTGFVNPGPDLAIITELGLPHSTQRYQLGFMGCYAAFPALQMAVQFCQAQPDAAVLIVCTEFCTLHAHLAEDVDSIVANSVFADGVAAALVSSRVPSRSSYNLRSFASTLLLDGEQDMAWRIGDQGFDMVLSKYVPKIIGTNISEVIGGILNDRDMSFDDIGSWAVHPGGKTILDKVQQSLDLSPSHIESSRTVLAQYGNMSSATILFVLKDILERKDAPQEENVFAVAFGPGLTVESALLTAERLACTSTTVQSNPSSQSPREARSDVSVE